MHETDALRSVEARQSHRPYNALDFLLMLLYCPAYRQDLVLLWILILLTSLVTKQTSTGEVCMLATPQPYQTNTVCLQPLVACNNSFTC